MDEATAEQLSRYLDGDLDAAAARRLEQRLAAEPDLEAELAALRRLQLQVRSVADRMVPPVELEAPFERPDLGAARRAARVPPTVRWLGLAAGLALAVTVAVEVARRPAPLPAPATTARPAQEPAATTHPAGTTGAAPLDTAAEADAAASLQTAPSPAKGALPHPPSPEHEQEVPAAVEQRPAAVPGRGEAAPGELHDDRAPGLADRAAPSAPAESVGGVAAAPKLKRATADVADEAAALNSSAERGAPAERAHALRLELTDDDGTPLVTLALPAGSADAGARLLVTVADGAIVAVALDAGGEPAGAALVELIGRPLPGLPDGRYHGAVIGDDAVP
ncbi:MAG TPA: hypothetical protein PKJ99_07865 [Thermoanaerobaculales bacterium]|nr:hypothetical protein [Thermoanaerobaculales bacterium]HPA80689.1 hypothetical protein [Thermoanaerobaculales bacterium]HQL28828.1 hypothetical protein [Thermoanaerobaculales bacterium]HQN97581.1 hypothetical protein [Thermoanaerobaculales bacterium]HQP42254.1 hypothetical protein [Thermoanaerobaculales bacterium]